MRKFLSHDSDSGQLRLVYTDLWDGQHERTEYRVTDAREGGRPVRRMAHLDGTPVHGTAPDLYIRGEYGRSTVIWTEQTALGPTVKTPCRRMASRSGRAKCSLCAELDS